MLELAGHFVPLVTPFTDDGATIGEVRLARLLRFYLEQGVDGFALCTDIGEFTSLTYAERKQVVEMVHRDSHGSKPLIINVSSMSTSGSLDLAQNAARWGARAVTVIPPYYGSFSQSELVDHFRVIAAYSPLPIIAIDPSERLKEDAKAAISHLTNVHLAWPQIDQHQMQTDWFRCYGLSVEPMTGVPESKASDFVLRNRAAVTKALLMDLDHEVGPPRMPVQPIPLREIRRAA